MRNVSSKVLCIIQKVIKHKVNHGKIIFVLEKIRKQCKITA